MEIITEETAARPGDFVWRERGGVMALTCRPLASDGFANAFSTRGGGVSPYPAGALSLAGFDQDAAANIHENRRRFLSLFDDSWRLMTAIQVHGADVEVIRADDVTAPDESRADALATDSPGILLGVKTADCVPLLLGDAQTGAAAAVHAGWRGTLARVAARTIERLRREFGTRPRDLRAAIGPAARACCYEVGPEVVEQFRAEFADADDYLKTTGPGHALIDLHEVNRRQLLAAGLRAERIHVASLCTMCRTDLFFSYRREKQTGRRGTGRSLSVIGRVPRPEAAL